MPILSNSIGKAKKPPTIWRTPQTKTRRQLRATTRTGRSIAPNSGGARTGCLAKLAFHPPSKSRSDPHLSARALPSNASQGIEAAEVQNCTSGMTATAHRGALPGRWRGHRSRDGAQRDGLGVRALQPGLCEPKRSCALSRPWLACAWTREALGLAVASEKGSIGVRQPSGDANRGCRPRTLLCIRHHASPRQRPAVP
jgi:hypothetical protein